MKNVSNFFKSAMRDTSVAREVISKIRFDVVETVGEYTSVVSSNVGYLDQIFNETDDVPKWISLEPTRFKLDGSMVIPSYSEKYEYGYISEIISDENGIINIEITIDFADTYTSNGLTFKFAELIKDFTITLDDSVSFVVTNNSSLTYSINQEMTYGKIKLAITKVEPYRRVRIAELYLGQILEFTNEEIVSVDIINESSMINDTVPSDELDFSIYNTNKQFDLLNPTGIQSYLKRNMPIKPYFAVKYRDSFEYVQMGKYYLDTWNTDKLEASFTAYSFIDQLENEEYRLGKVGTRTLYSMIDELLGAEPHEIDASLSSITVNSYLPIMTKREALQKMLQVGNCLLRVSENGTIIVDVTEDLATRNLYANYSGQHRSGEIYTQIDNAVSNIYINSDSLFSFPKVEQQKPYSSVVVKVSSFTIDADVSTLYSGTVNPSMGVPVNVGYKVWIPFSDSPSTDIVVTGLSVYDIYANGIFAYITTDVSATITGKKITVDTVDYIKTKYDFDNKYEIDNTLVINDTMADGMCDFILRDFTLKASADYRGFAYLDTVDKIVIETEYGDLPLYITKQSFSYDGALSGKVEGLKYNE